MRILLNLVPLKTGGGQQVGLAFLRELEAASGWGHEWLVTTSRGTRIDEASMRLRYARNVRRVVRGLHHRLWHELIGIRRVVSREKPDVAFTLMGPTVTASVRTVTGTAYSNLFYPEVDFWRGWPWHLKLMYEIRDLFLARRTKQADVLIVETDQLRARAQFLLGSDDHKVMVVRPSKNPLVNNCARDEQTKIRCDRLPAEKFKVLILSGWHINKGITLIPHIAAELRDLGVPAHFVITVEPDHALSQALKETATRLGVEDQMTLFGSVPPEGCVELYRVCDATLLLSVLESFSNNITETWAMSRPLIVTDAAWSRAICGQGAAYVDRLDVRAIAETIRDLQEDPELRQRLVSAGVNNLSHYPSAAEKAQEYVRIIESAMSSRHSGSISKTCTTTAAAQVEVAAGPSALSH